MPSICRDCAWWGETAGDRCPQCGSDRVLVHPELFDLTIAHVDCDAFYASVEKRDNPDLRDKPVIVGHPGRRGVVTTACYIARTFGPRSAMPMFKALELCPQAVVVRPDMVKYKRASAEIRALFRLATAVLEPVSLDEAYLDLGPGIRLVDRPPAVLLVRLARAIERTVGVTVSVGLSYNKSLAKLASDRDKPRGFAVIGRSEAVAVLASLPVRAIHGVGQATAQRLGAEGITTVAQLQALPEAALVARFGKFGRALAHLVQGEDPRQVVPDRPCKSVSTETTFVHDLSDGQALSQALEEQSRALEGRLKRAGLAGETVVLKLKTATFQGITRQTRLPCPTQRADVLYAHALPLLERLVDGRSFRLIGIGVDHLVPAHQADPPDLFDGMGLPPAEA
jgi:DNA polymerase-4